FAPDFRRKVRLCRLARPSADRYRQDVATTKDPLAQSAQDASKPQPSGQQGRSVQPEMQVQDGTGFESWNGNEARSLPGRKGQNDLIRRLQDDELILEVHRIARSGTLQVGKPAVQTDLAPQRLDFGE